MLCISVYVMPYLRLLTRLRNKTYLDVIMSSLIITRSHTAKHTSRLPLFSTAFLSQNILIRICQAIKLVASCFHFLPTVVEYSNAVAAVQHERGPRHSTLRRQISLCLKTSSTSAVHRLGPPMSSLSAAVALVACNPPPPPPTSLYRSPPGLPIRPTTFTATNSDIFNLLSSELSPAASNVRLSHALRDVSFCTVLEICQIKNHIIPRRIRTYCVIESHKRGGA